MAEILNFRSPRIMSFTPEELLALKEWSIGIFESFRVKDVQVASGTTDEGEDWLVFTENQTGAILHSIFIENGKVHLSSEFTEEDIVCCCVSELMEMHAPKSERDKWGFINVV